jgi:hypothetical protein
MSNPIGLHIQAQNFTPEQKRVLYDHCRRAQYTTCTVMDNYDVAMDLTDVLPKCVVVYRDSNYEPSPENPGDFHWWLKAHSSTDPRSNKVILMVNCEQGFSAARCAMWAWMIREAKKVGRLLCVGNTSSGTPQAGTSSDEPNDWLLAKPVFKAIRDCGGYLSVHEYTGFFTWSNVNGLSPVDNYQNKPTAIDWTKPLYHLGRLIAIPRACQELNLPVPPVIITEGFIDNMADIEHWFGVKSDGWQLLIWWWAKMFPGIDPEDFLADNHIWAWEKIYASLGFVIGVHIYCYGDANGTRWRYYRVDQSPRYLARMENYHPGRPSEKPPMITTLQNPLPADDPRWQEGTLRPTKEGGTINLRLAPQTTQNNPIAKLISERPCKYAIDPAWGTWGQVFFTDDNVTHAWVSAPLVTFTPKPAEPPVEHCIKIFFQGVDRDVVQANVTALVVLLEQVAALGGNQITFQVE